MLGLFVALGIAILTLIVILLWFVPHLLQQQARQVSDDSAKMREMLYDILSEQEVVTMRQGQLGTTVFYLQEQFDQLMHVEKGETAHLQHRLPHPDALALKELEQRVQTMQIQIETAMQTARVHQEKDNESWAYLLTLLSAVMDRLGELSKESDQTTVAAYQREYQHYEHRCHR